MSESDSGEPQRAPGGQPLSGRKVAAVLGLIAMVVLGAALFGNLWAVEPEPVPVASAAGSTPNTSQAPQGTLGIRLDEVRSRWNEVTSQPELGRALRRTPETGEFDSFFHRFDAAANISGAYRDSDEYLVAVKVEVGLGHLDVSTMHVHLCHLVSPFSPECLQRFEDTVVDGREYADLVGSGIDTSFEFDGNTWRVEESEGVLTIRVIAPDTG